jgi:streptogramin lyase
MRSLVSKLLIASVVALVACVCAASASAAPAVTGKFELGSELETNNKITAGADGNMWFTLIGAKDVGSITPAGVVQEFELPEIENPIGIATGPEGRIWVVATNKATSFLPSDPEGTAQNFTSALINGQPNIALGPEGMFWVASLNKVAKFSPANFNGTITEVKLSGTEEISPKDIDVAGSLIVIADTDTVPVLETSRVVTFTSAGVERDITIPGPSQGVAGAPSGQVAYSAPGAVPEQSGLITPPAPASAFELLGDPFGVAYGADQAFWIAQFAKGQLTRLTTTGQISTVGGLPIESARQIAAGPNNTLWVTLIKKEGLVEVSAIARVSGLEPPVTTPPTPPSTPPGEVVTVTTKPVPDTSLGRGPKKVVKTSGGKATVKFTFSSTVAGAEFQCRLVKTPTPSGKKKKKKTPTPAFAACGSPRVLKLAPGKYRFAVRAVAAGVTDASPAESTFTVVHKAKRPKHR